MFYAPNGGLAFCAVYVNSAGKDQVFSQWFGVAAAS